GRLVAGSRPRTVQSWLALGGSLEALPRGRVPAHAVGDRVIPGHRRSASPGVVLPLWPLGAYAGTVGGRGRLRVRRGRLQRRSALFHHGQGHAPPRGAL